jgi:predicted Zn-dependent protease
VTVLSLHLRRDARRLRQGAAALVLVLLAACAAEQRPGVATVGAIPPAAPRITGLERAASREHARLIAAFGGEYRAPAAEKLIEDVLTRLGPATERPDQSFRVTLLNSPVVNAFALPTGNVYVTRGLLALANDTSEIAAVLAHEIAHVTANHALARAELEQRSVLVSRVVAEVLNDPGAGQMVRNESRVSLASFSRAQELEADRIGVRTIAKAGFDPYGASRFLGSLGRNSAVRMTGGAEKPGMDFLSSHPSTPERVQQALAAARQIGAPGVGEGDRARYLAAVDGIVYGDDPTEGFVRGRRFAHPGLAITFMAPEGFGLENTAQAVLGIASGGGQALRFDGVQVPADQPLDAFLASGWIDGLENQSIETTSVNGLPAATATARGKEWVFRLGAVRIDNTVYRLLFATRTMNAEVERAFRQTLDSIRKLSPEEVRAVRPLRISIVTARDGDTAEALASRMAGTDRVLERFLVINGLDRAGSLKPGQRYKIIVE